MAEHLPALVVVVPLLTALLIPLAARARAEWAWGLAAAALTFSAAGAIVMLLDLARQGPGGRIVYEMGAWSRQVSALGINYVVDLLNAIVLTMIAVIGVVTVTWMRRSVKREIVERARPSYYAVLLLCCSGYLGITITGDVFNLYVFLEIASITTYVLIAMGTRRKALYAGYSYLIVGSVGATFILLGIGHLYMQIGTLDMADIAAAFQQDPDLYDSSVVRTSFAFFTVGLAIKMALFPLHGWQPNAYTQAPSASSLFIAATATKVSAYAFYRIAFGVFGVEFLSDALPAIRDGVLVMATAAIVVGPLIAIRQSNLKRLLAYSSVGQIGYIMLGVVLLNEEGMMGGLIHFWNHAAAKGALFCVAGAMVYASGAARVQSLAGMGRTAPWTSAVLTVAGCSMVGVPLTAGFLSKWYLGAGALEADRWYIVPVLLASSLFTAIYVWRLLQLVWFAPADTEPDVTKEVPWSMRVPAIALAAACLVFGLTPLSVDLARDAVASLGMSLP